MIYLILFFSFFIIGLFTFGGGYAMIPLIEDLVISKEWMTIDEFYSFLKIILLYHIFRKLKRDFLCSFCVFWFIILFIFYFIW